MSSIYYRAGAAFTQAELQTLCDGGEVRIGSKLYRACHRCRHVVCLNKRFFGNAHVCESGGAE